jgi:hypothetical protein
MKTYSSIEIQTIFDNYNKGITEKRLSDILYRNKWGVKNGNLAMSYTNDEILEFAKCKHDPIYFFETYCKIFTPHGFQSIKLRQYQKDFIQKFYDNRFNVAAVSRQTGITTMISLLALYEATFEIDQAIVILGINMSSVEHKMDLIQNIYENLPFFLKPGVSKYDKTTMSFSTGSRIVAKSKCAMGFNIDTLFIDDFAFMTTKDQEDVCRINLPVMASLKRNKLLISSSPNGINRFYEIWNNAGRKAGDPSKNNFIQQSIYWWEVPGRDDEWKKKEIANIGIDAFNQQYDLQFIHSKSTIDEVVLPVMIKVKKENKNHYINNKNFIPMGHSRIDGFPYYKYIGTNLKLFAFNEGFEYEIIPEIGSFGL